ncbi:MAG TPA: transketolase [Dehalococcoidia bacterium]|nr:transketolase [Dehalococcoidia bacterium]
MSVPALPNVTELNEVARRVRRHVVRMTAEANSGHPGGSLSAADILVAIYFGGVMRHDAKNPWWPDRDRFILSKGHITPGYYGVLAEAGYFPVDELLTFRKLGSRLQGHTVRGVPEGVEMSAGALGMGLSFSLGQILAARLEGRGYRVFCLLSDGDCNEGQTWEAAMSSAHHKAENLIAVVDYNHIQNDGYSDYTRYHDGDGTERVGGWVMPSGYTVNIMSTASLDEKWRAFGWDVQQCDGHDIGQLVEALRRATQPNGKPRVIIASTIKGKGVSFMENNPAFHGKAPTPEQLEQALKELAG